MQALKPNYDVAIIGGGLAGLSLAIQLSRAGRSVVLFEKEQYPYHKVCGEYISSESRPFLEDLGMPLDALQLPYIRTLRLSAPNGTEFTTALPLGGFGISRFLADRLLADLAVRQGVTLLEETRVDQVVREEGFRVHATGRSGAVVVTARVCCGAYGKRSNLDVRWKRGFIARTNPRQNNYIGVKYHIRTDWPEDVIGLHNFRDGYCGISRVEGDRYCLCYLTTAANLRTCGHSLATLEQRVLSGNPALRRIFSNSQVCDGFPVTIAQISFSKKNQSERGVLMLGDAAGMIAPLCGNGMSMALHSSKMAAGLIPRYLDGQLTFEQLEAAYARQWKGAFAQRLAAGRLLQGFFGGNLTSNLFVGTFRLFPFLAAYTIRKTHGTPF